MASRTTSCFHSPPQGFHQPYEIAAGHEEDHHRHVISADFDSTGTGSGSGSESTAVKMTSLIYNLSVLKDKVNQVQALVTLLVSPSQGQPEQASVAAVASMGSLIQEIIYAASSMLFACQQMPTNSNANQGHDAIMNPHPAGLLSHHQSGDNRMIDHMDGRDESSLYPETGLDWYDDHHNTTRTMVNLTDNEHINSSSSTSRNNKAAGQPKSDQAPPQAGGSIARPNSSNYDIIELDAAELLAKYTHYCQICGKGFKRDANLRMHMRAHGDEYKSSSALSNPLKKRTGPDLDQSIIDSGNEDGIDDKQAHKSPIRKYSCPHEGCRWNQRHANFQPLKSMICVKNHYKRSHCPKMYVCKRCNRKQFSVLSDLRTHEKHCGDLKWQCSCGTTFSRKDKLMGHVALFAGHSPMISPAKPGAAKVEQWSAVSMQTGDGQGNL